MRLPSRHRPELARQRAAALPMYRGVELNHDVTLPILGVPVAFTSNSPAAMDAVNRSFGAWRGRAVSRNGARGRPIRVVLVETEGDEETAGRVPIAWRMPDDHRMIGFTRGSVGIADLERLDVHIYTTRALLADRPHFCYGMLEALVLTAVGTRDRSPIHAAALVRGDSVVLLSGRSGSGKSTLAYAATQAGWRLLSDDASYIQLRPSMAIWGVPGQVLLVPETSRTFPENASLAPSVTANGKVKVQVWLDPANCAPVPVQAKRVVLVVLDRSEGPPGLSRIRPGPLEAGLSRDLDVSFALYPKMRAAVRRITRLGGWRLRLSADPREALPFLDRVLEARTGRTDSRR